MKAKSNCRWAIWLIFLLLFGITGTSSANSGRTFKPSGGDTQSIMGAVDFIEDKDGAFTLDQVVSGKAGEFAAINPTYHSFGYTNSVIWVRFTLDLSAFDEDHFFLVQEFEHLSKQELFYPLVEGKYARLLTGEDVPLASRMYATRSMLLWIPTPKYGPTTYYLKLTPKRGIYADVNLKWASAAGAIKGFQTQNLVYGLFFGSLIILWCYNFFLWVGTRDKLHLYYIYYLGSFIVAFFYIDGYANLVYDLGPISVRVYRAMVFASMHGLVLFARQFLALHQKIRWLDNWLLIEQWLLFVIGAGYLFFLPTESAYLVSNVLNLLLAPPMLLAGYLRIFRGNTPDRIYSLGWTFLILSTVIYVLRVFGAIPANALTEYSAQAGSTCEALLFSLALVSRFNVAQEEKRNAIREKFEVVELERARMEIEIKVRTKELEASRNEAVKANAEKRKLIHKVNTIAEFERKSIAVEIHDELNATLVGAKFASQRILAVVGRLDPIPEHEEIKVQAESIVKVTKDLYVAGRAIVTRLRPEILDTLGLGKAIEEIVTQYNHSSNTCAFTFESVGDFTDIEGGLTMAVYRLSQEALSNVVKHSQATQTSVSLMLSHDHKTFALKIKDNGIGFDPANVQSGLGLVGMRERVFGYNGKIDIRPGVDGGTEIEANFPVSPV